MASIPRVFISYSHDSSDHRRWVAELATRLMDNGVEVILDQWEVEPGDDLMKFMEHSVRDADRVLVVCTDKYVQKADAGVGGVGYESMIVTGELVKDQGTRKFIPIICGQPTAGDIAVPSYLSTRTYVDLSNESRFDDSFDRLLRTLHGVPASSKPQLGRNPFGAELYDSLYVPDGETTLESVDNIMSKLGSTTTDVDELYTRCLRLIRAEDTLGWRKLIQGERQDYSAELTTWYEKYGDVRPEDESQLVERTMEAASIYESLICIGLAGVESAKEPFRDQISLITDAGCQG